MVLHQKQTRGVRQMISSFIGNIFVLLDNIIDYFGLSDILNNFIEFMNDGDFRYKFWEICNDIWYFIPKQKFLLIWYCAIGLVCFRIIMSFVKFIRNK